MRILLSPLPKPSGGPGVFLGYFARELERRKLSWTSYPYHYLGIRVPPWTHAFVSGRSRRFPAIRRSKRPYVLTIGKPELEKERQAVGRTYDNEHRELERVMVDALLSSQRVAFISSYVEQIWEDRLKQLGLAYPPGQLRRVIHHGVDLDKFSPDRNPTETGRPFTIGASGALRERFRIRTMFEASSRLDFDHKILLVGSMSAEAHQEFEKAIADPAVKARTEYVPWISPDRLPTIYRRMDCLFHPVDYEGCGNVLLEAMACGVPIIVPQHGAPKEYVAPLGGIVVKTREYEYDSRFVELMAEAITAVRQNTSAYQANARCQALKTASICDRVDEYLNLLGLAANQLPGS